VKRLNGLSPRTKRELIDYLWVVMELHLHLERHGQTWTGWRMTVRMTKLCGTKRCLKIKLREKMFVVTP